MFPGTNFSIILRGKFKLMRNHLAYPFLCLFIFWSCASKEQPINKEEVIVFAKKIESSLRNRDSKLVDSIFHDDVFSKRIAKAAGAQADKSFIAGVIVGLKNQRLGNEIILSLGEDGSYEFLRYYERDQHPHIVFRLFGRGGINYHDFELVKFDNRIKAADMFIYLSGEELSKTLATTMITMTGVAKDNSDKELVKYASSIKDIKALINAQRYSEAKELFNKLPFELKKDKLFQLMNIKITSQLDTSLYKQALNAFEKQYANDASAQLSLIDAYFLNKDYKKALRAIDVVDSAVNKDPLLNYYRALTYTQMGDKDNTIKYLEVLYKQKPGFTEGNLELIANYIETNEHEKASLLIAAYKANKKLDQAKLENLKLLYPEFARNNGF